MFVAFEYFRPDSKTKSKNRVLSKPEGSYSVEKILKQQPKKIWITKQSFRYQIKKIINERKISETL